MVVLRKRGNIRIELSPETEASPAVAVTIRPVGQADIDVALGQITTSVVKAEDGAAALLRYGVEAGETPADVLRMAMRLGDGLLAIELGIRHIVAWEGVGLDDDTDAPVEPAGIALLFNEWAPAGPDPRIEPRESYGSRFMRRINGLSTLEPGAKKG